MNISYIHTLLQKNISRSMFAEGESSSTG